MGMDKQTFLDGWAPFLSQDDLSEINTCLFYFCKNTCSFCIHYDKLRSVEGYSEEALLQKLEVYKQVIPKCKFRKVLLVLIGGEIFSHVPPSFFDIYKRFYDELTELCEGLGKEFAIEFCTNLQIRDPAPVEKLLAECPNTMITTSYDLRLRGSHLKTYERNLRLFYPRISAVVSLLLEDSMEDIVFKRETKLFKYIYDNFLTVYEPYIEVKPEPKSEYYEDTLHDFKMRMKKDYPKTLIIDEVACSGQEFFVFPQTKTFEDVKEVTVGSDASLFSQGIQTTSC